MMVLQFLLLLLMMMLHDDAVADADAHTTDATDDNQLLNALLFVMFGVDDSE